MGSCLSIRTGPVRLRNGSNVGCVNSADGGIELARSVMHPQRSLSQDSFRGVSLMVEICEPVKRHATGQSGTDARRLRIRSQASGVGSGRCFRFGGVHGGFLFFQCLARHSSFPRYAARAYWRVVEATGVRSEERTLATLATALPNPSPLTLQTRRPRAFASIATLVKIESALPTTSH